MALSRHPGSSSGRTRFTRVRPKPRRTFRSRCRPTVLPAARRRGLGPRSLDPAALFGARLPSLFEARRRLTTSATAFHSTCGQPNPGPLILAGTVASTTFLFSTQHAFSLRSGDARRAARRPPRRPRCWFFLLAQVCPAAMPPRALSLRRVNVHGSPDRVKDASRGGGNDGSCLASGAHAWRA